MTTCLPCYAIAVITALSIFLCNGVYAQTPTTFDRGLNYFNAIEELDTKFDGLRAAGMKLIAERQDAINRLIETKKTVAQIADAQALTSLALAQAELIALANQAEMNGILASQTQNSPIETGVDVRHTPQVQLRAQTEMHLRNPGNTVGVNKEYGKQLASSNLQYDLIRHQMKTLNAAGKLAVERHVSILRELEKIVNEMVVWNNKTMELFNHYWSLADVAGVKSDFELRAGLRQLNRSSEQNAGAILLKSITLIRLEQYEEAIPLLNLLSNAPALQVVVTAIHAEVLARTDKKREAIAELRKTVPIGLNDPRVRMHRAMTFAACDELKLAEAEWEALLKLGGFEVAGRRALALINASNPMQNDRTKSKAMENAQLAVKLDDADWASKIALALATSANGDAEKGAKLATEAADLATGSNQTLCDEIAEQLLTGKFVSWSFK